MAKQNKSIGALFAGGLLGDNPGLRLALGICPMLAVTTRAANGLALGLATGAVLVCTGLLTSILRALLPEKGRLPVLIVISAMFATVARAVMAMCFPEMNAALGVYVPLIAVSSVVLCRADGFAAENGIPAALADDASTQAMLVPGGRLYEQREACCRVLDTIEGLSYVKNHAAFYIFPKLDIERFHITDDNQFAFDFLHEKHVMIIPGRGFSWKQPDHFRIVMLPRPEQLADAMEKMCSSRTARLEMGKIGQKRVEMYYRHGQMIEKYRQLYIDVEAGLWQA